ncbi:MAG: hypothetical protein R3E88_08310 [Myxococcota bacterium]
MADVPPVELGHALVGFLEPHAGHERAFHRWYARDHLYRAGVCAPGTLAARLWIAPPDLRALREPRGANPIGGDAARGTHLSTFWVQQGALDEQQRFVAASMEAQRARGESFPHRDHLFTHRYRHAGSVRRDPDGVPPELALDHRYAGLVAAWVDCAPGQPLAGLESALRERALPALLAGSPAELAVVLALMPKPPEWPADFPEPPGLGQRLLVLCFVAGDVRDAWPAHFAGLASRLAAHGAGTLALAAPFDADVPGVDPDFL